MNLNLNNPAHPPSTAVTQISIGRFYSANWHIQFISNDENL